MTGRIGALIAGTAIVLIAASLTASRADAAVVVNGDFETGNLNGWTVEDPPPAFGSWFAYSGTTTPLTGSPVVAPPQGIVAGTTDQTGPGSHILYQDVALEPNMEHRLSAILYYSTTAALTSPDSLDPTVNPNQQYRVDVMRQGASTTSVSPGDVLLNLFGTNTGGPTTLAPIAQTANLTPFAGQTVRLRFAEVDNVGPMFAGADAVSITSTPTSTGPGPKTKITQKPKNRVKSKKKTAKATFAFTSDQTPSTFECSLDGAPFTTCTSPLTVSVKKGAHTFSVRAKNAAGTADVSPATDDWTVKRKKKKKK